MEMVAATIERMLAPHTHARRAPTAPASVVITCDIWMPASVVDSLQRGELVKEFRLVHRFFINLSNAVPVVAVARIILMETPPTCWRVLL